MPLSRVYENAELAPDVRRILEQARVAFDIPFVPSLLQVCAGVPEYLRRAWADLQPVAESREFDAASESLAEWMRSVVVSAGWTFSEQERLLVTQKFSVPDTQIMAGVAGTFARALPRLALFARLMQRGYSGGQKGRVSPRRTASVFSRMVTLHIPGEREASLRAWLIYSEIRRAAGIRHVPDMFRAISPYPGYLGAVWLDTRRLFADASFAKAREETSRRSSALLTGLPVKDHRAMSGSISQDEWNDIEQTVDAYTRVTLQVALAAFVWRRSFATPYARLMAA